MSRQQMSPRERLRAAFCRQPCDHVPYAPHEGPVRLTARRGPHRAEVSVDASGQNLRIRRLDPRAVQEVRYSSTLKDARWRQTRGQVAIDFALRGRGRFDIEFSE